MTGSNTRRGTRLGQGLVRFRFDGRDYTGQEGDTAASALLASGVSAFGRSVKYRRLRGLLAAGPEDPNALLTVGVAPAVIPNVPAAQLRLRDGLVLRSQNRWPSLRWDVASALQVGGGFLGAGFYYKTFMWPSWPAYESLIRALAGLGEAPGACELPQATVEYLSCDVLVAGAGPAGLTAALAAARAGGRVVIVEREPVAGGELEFETATIDGKSAPDWIADARHELDARGARMLLETTFVGGSSNLHVAHRQAGGILGAEEVYKIRSRVLVLALGAIERPIVFVDNDRPGVMLVGAAERISARYGALNGRTAVLFANHDRVYAAALRLLDGGIRIKAIIDSRASSGDSDHTRTCRARLQAAGIECMTGHVVLAAQGRGAVRAAVVAPIADTRSRRVIACDFILVSGGWSPAIHPGVREGGEQQHAAAPCPLVADAQSVGRVIVGAARATFELPAIFEQTAVIGAEAARSLGLAWHTGRVFASDGDAAPRLEPCWRSPCSIADERRQFVDLQNDVTVADLRAALAEGFADIEHVKRYTTLGVGTEQGRTSGMVAADILAELKGQAVGDVGLSRARPPYHPTTLQALAGLRVGASLRVTRRTALHAWHAANGGVLDPMGLWLRPRYYRSNGADAFTAAVTEARRVRATGGIVDGSTLGKIEIAGPDAAAFLDTLYLRRASTIKTGRAKYMVNLREDGIVLDDGLVLRLEADRFIATTSSSHGGHMVSHMEFHRVTVSAALRVTITDVTDAWAVIAVAGPTSRNALVSVLGAAWRESIEQLQHMQFARGAFDGLELTVLRASFSGELAYELHIRPAGAMRLWEALTDSGLAPYGIDALDILRLEKGYLAGSEINGETTPFDLNMEGCTTMPGPCLGMELLQRPGFHEQSRPRLVGVRAEDGKSRFLAGAQLTVDAQATRPCGYVTSSAFSPALEQWIGLALVARSLATDGTTLVARDPLRERAARVRIGAPVHVDPDGVRMKS